jgi:uncharacterized protein
MRAVIFGLTLADLRASIGDRASFCVAALLLPALFVAPTPAHWSSRASVVLLPRPFAPCLCATDVRMVLRP